MTDVSWIDAVLTSARPRAMAALVRNFRDLDLAEEAFQEACLRALRTWPQNGPPRDAAAWLIMVGKNAAIDTVRRQRKEQPLPPEMISDLSDAEASTVARIDEADYRDDILRLLFVCCHPQLPATQQIALALRIVSGLSPRQIARAFLVSDDAMEQRIRAAAPRSATKPSDSAACCCGCSPRNPRSWRSPPCYCFSMPEHGRASMPKGRLYCSRSRTANAGIKS